MVFASYLFNHTRYEKSPGRKSVQNDLPNPFIGLQGIGWWPDWTSVFIGLRLGLEHWD